ncbi:MAG: class D sortase [Anaerolineaceae bacterium]|nr:class D sortase [Anaerolineaceae bacterium]
MRDKRPVDELSVEELERILAIKKREERQAKLQRMKRSGRLVEPEMPPPLPPTLPEVQLPVATAPAAPPSVAPAVPAKRQTSPHFEDDPDVDKDLKHQDKDRFWKAFVNQSLLLVEIAAVIGLVFLGYNLLIAIGALEKETATAQALADEQRRAGIPTIEPTPQIQLASLVLPGGHTPPTAPDGGQFNYNEIPEGLHYLVESQLIRPVIAKPPVTAQTALQINIPKLNIDATIVQGTDWESLKAGVGQLINGANPSDDNGNLVLAAHNDIYGSIFRYLDLLEIGDEFTIRTEARYYTYRITGREIVEPDAVQVMHQTDGPTATLITCYPYQVDTQRIVVFAERID